MSNKKWLISITLILSVMSNNALAQDSESCDEEKVDTVSLRQCGMQELGIEKSRLDLVYKKLTAILDSNEKQRLKTSQIAWVDFSKKDCSFRTDWETGSMGSLMSIGCETGLTKDRRKNLENRLISELRNK